MDSLPNDSAKLAAADRRAQHVRPQFRISDLLIVMVGAAVGLAGGTWIAADIFAALLGLLTLIGLLIVHLIPPQSHTGKVIWATVVLAYVTAVGAALVKAT
jgi:hypothetical protein